MQWTVTADHRSEAHCPEAVSALVSKTGLLARVWNKASLASCC
jgi:hypothetical protein